jgi:DNA-binding CsgD family transcriptional regulator
MSQVKRRIARQHARDFQGNRARPDQNTRFAPISPLSEQEQRILRLFAKAKNSSEIARELGITLPTLRNHLHSINEKLRTHNRLEAVMHAMQRGLI